MKTAEKLHFCDIVRHGILEKLHQEFVHLTDVTDKKIALKCLNSDDTSHGAAGIKLETNIRMDSNMHKYINIDKMQASAVMGIQFASAIKQKMLEVIPICMHAAYSNLDKLPRALRKQLSFSTRSKKKFNHFISGHRQMKWREATREYGIWMAHPETTFELVKNKWCDNIMRVLSMNYLCYSMMKMREEGDYALTPKTSWWSKVIAMDSRQLMQGVFCLTMSEAVALATRETVIELEHKIGADNIEQILTLKCRFQIGLKGFEYTGRQPATLDDLTLKESWKPVEKFPSDYGALMLTKQKNVRELLTAAVRRSKVIVDHLFGR